ncbi:MAG: hypothetical protein V1867_03220 [Candidatus Falkowbacteria bacterium]
MGFWKNILYGMASVGAGMASLYGYRHPRPKYKRFKHRTYEEIMAEVRRFPEAGKGGASRGQKNKK